MNHQNLNNAAQMFLSANDPLRAIKALLLVETEKRDTKIIHALCEEGKHSSAIKNESHEKRFRWLITTVAALNLLPDNERASGLKAYFRRLLKNCNSANNFPLIKNLFLITNLLDQNDKQKYQQKIIKNWPDYGFNAHYPDWQKWTSPETQVEKITSDFFDALENEEKEGALYNMLLLPGKNSKLLLMI